MTPTRWIVIATLCLAATACAVRDGAMYRDDTRKLLETKQSELRQCYDAELQKDPKAGGKVVVSFTIQKDTGVLINPKIDDLQSTPNRTLRRCVVDSLKGLTLEPADERDGEGTFTWQFQAKGA
ncbi:MAG TPA: AgmX/PglI C-terminal domain-containing protein [Polyangiales bacterium]|nr:AgmX/PglI C-terminal domain-containing protein [Polyangiales bacterium]